MELLFLSALIVGIVVGLIPGFGLFSALVTLYPLLVILSPLEILVFYAVMGSASQFSGSITASVLGVAGEASSVPATKEGPLLFSKNQGPDAIGFAAIGSVIGTFLVSGILYFGIDKISNFLSIFYNNDAQTFLFFSVLLIILISGTNKLWLNMVYVIFGFFLANIGLQRYFVEPLTFGIDSLSTGIPFISLALGLYSLPQVYFALSQITDSNRREIKSSKFFETLRKFKSVWKSSIRGSLIGMFAGMTPGLTTILSSNLSYSVEKYLRKRKKEYDHTGDINCLVSAETANNSGFLTSLLPLVIFGIPIIGSEAMILNLIEQGGTAVGLKTLMSDGMFETVIIFYLLAGIISLFIAWQGARYCLLIYNIPKNILLTIIITISFFSVAVYSFNSTSYLLNFVLLFSFLALGYLLRRTDTSPVLFAFLIYPFLESTLYRFFIIHLS